MLGLVLSSATFLHAPVSSRPALTGSVRHLRALTLGPEFMDLPTASGCGSVLIAEAVDAMDPSTTTGSVVRQTEEAIRAASGELGWWGSYIKLVEDGIIALHDAFQGAGIPNACDSAPFKPPC